MILDGRVFKYACESCEDFQCINQITCENIVYNLKKEKLNLFGRLTIVQ